MVTFESHIDHKSHIGHNSHISHLRHSCPNGHNISHKNCSHLKVVIWILRGCVTFYYFFPFNRLQGRVDRMENSIQPLSMKIDFVLLRLDEVFKKRKLKKDDMEKIFEGIIGNSSGTNTV